MSASLAPHFPRVSVITPVMNAEGTLAACLKSVREQTYPYLEHIVIDGGSKDASMAILQANAQRVSYSHSKPDKGISDAFNQGIEHATGDYFYFLGASDTLYARDVIARLLEGVPRGAPIICGQIQRTDEETGKPLWVAPHKIPKKYNKYGLLKCLTLPHQGLLLHRNYFEEYGLFDLQWRYAMDYELILRSFHQFPPVIFKEMIVANWRAGGIGAHHLARVFDEYHQMKLKHQIAPAWMLSIIDILIRCRYRLGKAV